MTPDTSHRRFTIFAILVAAAWLLWGLFGKCLIGFSAGDAGNPYVNVGQFGDSFGALNTLFAGIAALGATFAYLTQREELKDARRDALSQHVIQDQQLVAMQKGAIAQNAIALVNYLQSEEVREARRIVRAELSSKPVDQWSPQDELAASKVVANFDVIAALLREDVIPVRIIASPSNWGPTIIHCFDVLKPYIEKHRGKPANSAKYWSNFEWLYQEAMNLKKVAQ